MPIYEYECRRCGHRFELIQKFSDKPRKRCPECRGAVDRLISPPAIRFKGTGWYVTDYAKKGSDGEKDTGEPKAKTGDGKDGGSSKDKPAKKESSSSSPSSSSSKGSSSK